MQLADQGYFVLPHFRSRGECDAILDSLKAYYENPDTAVRRRGAADERIFGAEYLSPHIRAFKHDPLCLEVARRFMGGSQCCLFTMANRLQKRGPEPARSGGRWHRDRSTRQFKAMLYLVDVTREMGPFSIFPKSGISCDKQYANEVRASGLAFDRSRWSTSEFAPFLEHARPRLRTFVAPAGTLVLFDSSLIHSGQPNTAGIRFALTNYYYRNGEMTRAEAHEKWAPFAGPVDPNA